MNIKRYALVTTALTGILLSTTAYAQNNPSNPPVGGANTPPTGEAPPAAVAAQQGVTEAVNKNGTVSEVVVTGIRKSVANSIALKRANDSYVDVITAEDVAKFPDLNVAEALSRVPGITIDYAAGGGEGNKVAILGVDSRLVNVELNGNFLSTSSTGVVGDGQGQQNVGRDFNFANLAPEIVGTIEVYKSTQAKLDEGAVGGTIIVNTRLPLDLPANTASISALYNYNVRTEDNEPRGTAFYSWHNDNNTFGILGTIAYNDVKLGGASVSVLDGYSSTCNTGIFVCNSAGTAISGQGTQGTVTGPLPTVKGGPLTANTLFPGGLSTATSVETEQRLTYQLAAQWRPVHDFEVNFTGLIVNANDSSYGTTTFIHSGRSYNDSVGAGETTKVKNPDGSTSTIINYPTTFTSLTTNAAGTGVTGGTLSAVHEEEDFQYNHQILDTQQGNVQMKWTPGLWNIEANVGASGSTGGVSPQYYASYFGHDSGTFALSSNSSSLELGTPLTNPNLLTSRAAGGQLGFVKTSVNHDDIEYAKFDVRRKVDWFDLIREIEVGYKYTLHRNKTNSQFFNTYTSSTQTISDFSYLLTKPSLTSGLGASGDLVSYAYLTQNALITDSLNGRNINQFSTGNPAFQFNDTGEDYYTDETDNAGYFQADFRNSQFHGDAGVRVVNTSNKQTYFTSQNYYPYIGNFTTANNSYTDVLPAGNLIYDLNQNQDLRLTIAKVMSRPSFGQESGQNSYNIQNRTGSGGNPNLGPYRAIDYSFSYEWYITRNREFDVDFIYRDVQQYIVTNQALVSLDVPQQTLDYCNIPVPATNGGTPACPGLTNPVQILESTPYNASKATVKGISVSYQGDLAWGFGITANATWLDQTYGSLVNNVSVTGAGTGGVPIVSTASNQKEEYPLPYLSKWSYTIAPYYENGPLQVHLSYTWRSDYNTATGVQGDIQFQSAYGQMDASATYNLTKKLQLTAAATNILDELVKTVTTDNLPLGYTKYGTRISAGLIYKFN